MRFTFPIITLCKGGAQRMLAEIANGLVEKGHHVNILMPSFGIVEFDLKANLIRTGNQLEARNYPPADVIVSNFYTTVPSAEEASQIDKGKHVRLSLCYEPMFLEDQHETFPLYQATPHLFVISKYQQQLIELNHGIRGEVVPTGISPVFHNLKQRGQAAPPTVSAVVRKTEGVEGGSWHRQQDYLMEVLRSVKRRYPSVQVELICPPNEFATSRSLKRLGTTGEFHFLTPHNDQDLCKYYNRSNIFVASSIFEAASMPSLEAMRCGAAVAALYSGGNADYLRNEETGLISYAYQKRLDTDISQLIENQGLRNTLATNGEKEADKWTWQRSVDIFESKAVEIANG